MRRVLTAKTGFTVWAGIVFAFLYLPILVMVVFAFNKPSAAAVQGLHVTDVGKLSPDQVGNVAVWNGFTPAWFSRRAPRPDVHPGDPHQPGDRPRRRRSSPPCSASARRSPWHG